MAIKLFVIISSLIALTISFSFIYYRFFFNHSPKNSYSHLFLFIRKSLFKNKNKIKTFSYRTRGSINLVRFTYFEHISILYFDLQAIQTLPRMPTQLHSTSQNQSALHYNQSDSCQYRYRLHTQRLTLIL